MLCFHSAYITSDLNPVNVVPVWATNRNKNRVSTSWNYSITLLEVLVLSLLLLPF